ncbi:ankyrin repeat-containing domain protein [Mariannaea sp. PMI_226]|nr:ankyrin repeat-containing domain protein [Mariannaea sp. PMI_226]
MADSACRTASCFSYLEIYVTDFIPRKTAYLSMCKFLANRLLIPDLDWLSQLRNAPDLIRALANEAQDISVVLTRLEETKELSKDAGFNAPHHTTLLADLETQLQQAKKILANIDNLGQALAGEPSTRKRVKWYLKRSRASELQKDLKKVRLRINELLVAHNSSLSKRIQLEVQEVRLDIRQNQSAIVQRMSADSKTTSDQLTSAQTTANHRHADLVAALQTLQVSISNLSSALQRPVSDQPSEFRSDDAAGTHQTVTAVDAETVQRIISMQRMLCDSLDQPKARKSRAATLATHVPTDNKPKLSLGISSALSNSALYVSLNLRNSRCSRECPCRCHFSRFTGISLRFPQVFNAIIGSLFIGYTGYPVSPARCNFNQCLNRPGIRLMLTYTFPLWLLSYTVHIFTEASLNGKFTAALIPYRRMDFENSEENILYQLQWGTVDSVRSILQRNPAAIFDVYYRDGRSVLMWAQSGSREWKFKLEMFKLLLSAGADADQEADYGSSVRSSIGKLILYQMESPQVLARLEEMFPLSSCIDDFGLTFLHKVVVGYCPINLDAALQCQSPEILAQVNKPDRSGETPLMYAVRRGDSLTVKALLEAGATVDGKTTKTGYSALLMAINPKSGATSSMKIIDLLLAAGADVDAVNELDGRGVLHYAARLNNVKAIGRLLSAGAKIECEARSKKTPLLHAIQHNSLQALQYLYDCGADIDKLDRDGTTALVLAIETKAHNALSLLLELGANHLWRRNEETLLHTAAMYGDERTYEILAGFELKGLDSTARCNGLTASQLFDKRNSVSDLTRAAFRRLLEVTSRNKSMGETGGDSSEGDDEFVDALETLEDNCED